LESNLGRKELTLVFVRMRERTQKMETIGKEDEEDETHCYVDGFNNQQKQ
jgi:hypothetical protein